MQTLIDGKVDLKDGIYPGMSRLEYERIEAINFSKLKHFRRTPAHAREEMLHPPAPTDAMDFGTAFHMAILEPARFAAEYVVAPKVDRRYAAGKAAWAEFEQQNAGKSILSAADFETLEAMQRSCYSHPLVKELLSAPSKREVAVVWTDRKTGVRCKSLIDGVVRHAGWTVLIDLKSCEDAGEYFGPHCARYGYHEQAAMYLDGLNALAPATRKWYWLAVEKKRPHCVAVREPDEDTLLAGAGEFRAHLDHYKHCLETNTWPGYPTEALSLRLPRYALLGDE